MVLTNSLVLSVRWTDWVHVCFWPEEDDDYMLMMITPYIWILQPGSLVRSTHAE